MQKYSKTKPTWFSRLLRHSARKQDGLILQFSQANTGQYQGKMGQTFIQTAPYVLLNKLFLDPDHATSPRVYSTSQMQR